MRAVVILFKLRLPAKKRGDIVGGKMALIHRNYSVWLSLVNEKGARRVQSGSLVDHHPSFVL
jgi:hypothetical protein